MTPHELEAQELSHLAQLAGCTVLASSFLESHGRWFPVLELECNDNACAIRFVNLAAQHDASDPEVRTLALSLRRAHPSPRAHAIAIHDFVKAAVVFVRELREVFQHTLYTLRMRAGDCDDHARVVAALAFAGGLKARIEGLKNSRGNIAHAAPQIFESGAWHWAETTVNAAYGEHPKDAARRLKVTNRTDVLG